VSARAPLTWVADPVVIAGIALAACAYARGLGRLWARAGVGHGVRRGQAASFAGGLAIIAVALVSPLDALDTALFSAHMVQHLLLMLAAALLLVRGAPLVPMLWALPPSWRRWLGHGWRHARPLRAAWERLTHPVAVWCLNVVALWVWHLPAPYEAALRHAPVHALEHACLLGTSLLFWETLVATHRRLARGLDILYVVTTGVQMSILGALLTFASAPWYPAQEIRVAAWHLTPLEDQQLAGLIMWVPSGVVYLLVAAACFVAWLRAEEAAMQRRESPGERSQKPEARNQKPETRSRTLRPSVLSTQYSVLDTEQAAPLE